MRASPYIIFLMGPTASGKTKLALNLVNELPCEIISVDSAMIYRGMNIGTGKPAETILAQIPHHLINICEPYEIYSAAQFQRDASTLIEKILSKERIPLLVGGTMLYFHALQYGLTALPAANPALRNHLLEEIERNGLQKLHQRLQEIDPESAKRIHPNDPQRILRAIEIYELSGKSLSTHITDQKKTQAPYQVKGIALVPLDREILHQNIATRFNDMLAQGFVSEVETLHQRQDLNADLPSMRAVGYRQIWQYLDGLFDHQTMCDHTIAATRQLAKRQLTWLRSWQGITTFDCKNVKLAQAVRDFLLSN